ncbi:hypothetical protein ACGFMM_05985 [Streptomyces sp. NPDC048604]|uniref:hypothetical protein n=1 Tax=Streptomyces sp. NPDC048604 TaxID=3365578 RepID=UPI0037217208
MATGIRWQRPARVLGIVAAVLALVAGVGWAVKPVWQPWWYASTLCGGHLSGDDLAELLPDDERLQAGRDTFGSGNDLLRCGVNESDGRHFVLKVEAQTDTGGRFGPLAMEFTIPRDPDYVYSKAVPGFYGKFGPVIIQECPKLGRDSEGRKQRLITNVYANGVETDPSPQTLRTAVRIANGANAELGCGAAPLPLPERVEAVRKLSLRQAEGTMCGWLSRVTLPKSPSGRQWQVVAPTDERAPITSCSLIDTGMGGSAVKFTGWYGEWTEEPFEALLEGNMQIPDGRSSREALLGERFGRAKARCGGEPANFLANTYSPDGTPPVMPMSEVRRLLNAFTADQAEQRACTALQLPGPTVHPDPR